MTLFWFFAFFFLSGMCSVMYEVIWLRLGMAHFGVTTPLISIFLSIFMAGLGLGGGAANAVPTGARFGGAPTGVGGGIGGGGGGGGIGGILTGSTSNAELTTALRSNASSYTWAAATVSANQAAGYQLAPVVKIVLFVVPYTGMPSVQAVTATTELGWLCD